MSDSNNLIVPEDSVPRCGLYPGEGRGNNYPVCVLEIYNFKLEREVTDMKKVASVSVL